MDCPACKIPMLVLEYAAIELDTCPGCRGTWFDAKEMGLLMEKLGIPGREHNLEEHLIPETAPGEAPRRCPLCRRRMDKARFGDSRPLIDACPRGEGIWFDRGERAQALLGAADVAQDPSRRILAFVREMFPSELSAEPRLRKGAP